MHILVEYNYTYFRTESDADANCNRVICSVLQEEKHHIDALTLGKRFEFALNGR